MGEEMRDMSCACFGCIHYIKTASTEFAKCGCKEAKVKGHEFAVRKGLFSWPLMFQPQWLIACDSYDEVKIE